MAHRRARDWIKAVRFLEGGEYAAVTAHNRLEIYSSLDAPRPTRVVQSSVRCLLYSAALTGRTVADLCVASGTIFNHVLLWSPPMDPAADSDAPVARSLVGHDGVIFNVRFSDDASRVISVSDDRSIRVWNTAAGTQMHALFGHSARVWMAHFVGEDRITSVSEDATARLWRLGSGATADECLAEWSGHLGKNVWCVAVAPGSLVAATGGNDGGVRLWQLDRHRSQNIQYEDQITQLALPTSTDVPRNFVLCGSSSIFILTKTGHLWTQSLETPDAPPVPMPLPSPHHPLTHVLAGSSNGVVAVLGAHDGVLHVYSPSHAWAPWTVPNVHTAKIMAMEIWNASQSNNDRYYTLAHDDANVLVLGELNVRARSWTHVATFQSHMPTPPFLNAHLIGSRAVAVAGLDGSLAIYPIPSTDHRSLEDVSRSVEPLQHAIVVIAGAHGAHHHISSIALLKYEQHAPHGAHDAARLVTAGRDGCLVHWELVISASSGNPDNQDEAAFSDEQPLDEEGLAAERAAVVAAQQRTHGADLERHIAGQNAAKVGRKFAVAATRAMGREPLSGTTWVLSKLHKERVTRGTLEKVLVVAGDQLLVVGFHQKRMFVSNHATHSMLFAVACGGAHRRWRIAARDAHGDDCSFAFVRNDRINLYHVRPPPPPSTGAAAAPVQRPPPMLLDSLHGREIRAALALADPGYILTASEDTSLAILAVHDRSLPRVVARLNKHVSVAKALARAGSMVFTAGGREELFAWQYVAATATSPPVLYDVARYLPSSAVLETRIMAVAAREWNDAGVSVLAVGFSDGRVQVLVFDEGRWRRLFVVAEANVERCVLQVELARAGSELYVIAGATNGHLFAWPVGAAVADYVGVMSAPPATFSLQRADLSARIVALEQRSEIQVHQSGINALDATPTPNGALLATGGDDNACAVTRLGPTGDLTLVWHEPAAHASSVTGARWVTPGHRWVTAAVDQRVNVWEMSPDDGRGAGLVATRVANVSDISALDVGGDHVYAAGLGLECLRLVEQETNPA
ncbi:hypothetical protein BC828DRAFT_382037 [Blastocladiella britannica]|nr:hypothetical protein BC828DRAFT_382037 [Blastocladiella britannica]